MVSTTDSNSKAIDKISTGLAITVTTSGTLTKNSFVASNLLVDTYTYLTFDITPSVEYNTGGFIRVTGPTPYVNDVLTIGSTCEVMMGFVTFGTVDDCSVAVNDYTVDMTIDTEVTAAAPS